MPARQSVYTGLDVLCQQQFEPLRGLRLGLVTHDAAIDRQFRRAATLFRHSPAVQLVRLFGPEHGLTGHAQDLEGVGASDNVVSLYDGTAESLRPTAEQLQGLDALVIDLVDIGSRYYTFQATMLYCLEAASRAGLLTVILDRPNPLGGESVEGPTIQPGYESFVSVQPIATRHGLTMGELATLYRATLGLSGELRVIRCQGWQRNLYFDETDLPWVLPSPNMPTLDTAIVYPGQCLLEGTNLSEGRGTTRPFEICGAPGLDADAVAAQLQAESLPGVVFRPCTFRPTFQKHTGSVCGGVQLHVTDRLAFQPVRTGLTVLAVLRRVAGEAFRWRTDPYEFISHIPAIDLLFGSSRERLALEAGLSAKEIARSWEAEEEAFCQLRRAFLLY